MAITALLLLLIEGIASYAHVAVQMWSHRNIWFQDNVRYDSELGWANIPNAYLPNRFGPGVYFRSNAQGFRNAENFSKVVPAGKFRIICSGDSFTMGTGVSNDQTWCQLLTQLDRRIQTVNMGQGGYGIDQAYLWYQRDASNLDLDLHIMAFIYDDFARMTYASRWGYAKPVLVIENGKLVTRNVPVPQHNGLLVKLADTLSQLSELRTAGALGHVSRLFASRATEQGEWNRQSEALPLAFKVFEILRDEQAQKNRFFVTVYLPIQPDCFGQGPDDKLRQAVAAESRKDGLWFWDLAPDCQQLPAKTAQGMFIAPDQLAPGHFTAEGNRLIADFLYRKMLQTPEIAARLQSAAPAAHGP